MNQGYFNASRPVQIFRGTGKGHQGHKVHMIPNRFRIVYANTQSCFQKMKEFETKNYHEINNLRIFFNQLDGENLHVLKYYLNNALISTLTDGVT